MQSFSSSLGSALVIAEMACAHEGQTELAYKLVDVAANAGAEAIQLQIFSVPRLITPFSTRYTATQKYQIPMAEWPRLIYHARQMGMQVWANVFDEEAFEIAMQSDVDGLKLHSSDVSNVRMLEMVGGAGKPVNLAVGGSTLDEIARAVFHLRWRGAAEITLMHGYQGYPTALEDARIGFIPTLKRLFGCQAGYQDHTDGGSELAIILPLVAIAAGASVLEKHYTDDRSRNGTDYESSLDPADFARFIQRVRETGTAIGDGAAWEMSAAEQKYRKTMKKKIVAAQEIHAGEQISDEMLDFMRADSGLTPDEASKLLGRKSRRDIPKFAVIQFSDLAPLEEENGK